MRTEILDLPVDDVSLPEIIRYFEEAVRGQSAKVVMTPNAEMVVDARRFPTFTEAFRRADLAFVDGVGLSYASAALYGQPFANRVTGVTAFQELTAMCAREGKRLLLFGGGNPTRMKAYAAYLRRTYPDLFVETLDPGVIDAEEPSLSESTREALRAIRPEVVALALQHRKQPFIMEEIRSQVPEVRLLIGIGGAVDTLSEDAWAPESWRKRGLEWLWRLLREPWRLPRILRAVAVFPALIAWETVKRRRFSKAVVAVVRMWGGRRRGDPR